MEEIIGEYRQFLQSIIDEYPFSKGNTASEMKARIQQTEKFVLDFHKRSGEEGNKIIYKIEENQKEGAVTIIQDLRLNMMKSHVPPNLWGLVAKNITWGKS